MTQPAFSAVREAVADVFATISGLRSTATVPLQVNPPMVVVAPAPGTFASYRDTMDGSMTFTVRASLFVSEANSKSGQDLIDRYVSTTGTYSVPAAFDADTTLGGLVEYAVVADVGDYGFLEYAGVSYLAIHFDIEVGI